VRHRRLALLALVLGLAAGGLNASHPTAAGAAALAALEPVGALWINALRMVVVPLVASMLVVGVASVADLGAVRRLGGTALAAWLLLLGVSAALGLTLVPTLFAGMHVDPAASAALRANAAGLAESTADGLGRMPSYAQWLVELVPTNPVRAAADGAMLPLVVFSLLFGLAATRLEASRRDLVRDTFGAVADAMLVLVRWILALAPIGVFALSAGVASRAGASVAGALGHYLVVTTVSLTALAVAIVAIAALLGRVSPLRLARALLPAQVVGFASRSSLASLPAQVEAARATLRLPAHATGFVLPLAVASFKPHGPLNWCALAVFSAALYGVPLGPTELLTVAGSATLLSFAVPGIPSAGMLLIAPVFAEVGIPVEAIGLLIAVDAIPDMFKTVVNVTGQLSSGVIVARFAGGAPAEEAALPSAAPGSPAPAA